MHKSSSDICFFYYETFPMWQHDIYDQGGDCSVITKTVGNGLVMLCHSPTDFFIQCRPHTEIHEKWH